ncbi:hypothetical protein SPD48_18480 [Pseudogracilibacillus sp. SE30717A]
MNKSRDAKVLIDSIIPLGMTFGSTAGAIFGSTKRVRKKETCGVSMS